MKIFLAILVTVSLFGCQSLKHAYYDRIVISNIPDTTKQVVVKYNYDRFEKEGWLTTDYYMSWFQSNYNGIAYKYRAFYKSEFATEPDFIQLYFVLKSTSWYFVNSFYNENGEQYSFTQVDRDVASGGNVYEYFAINLSPTQLKELSDKDMQLKMSGKKGTEIFSISSVVTKSFLNKINDRK